MVSTRRLSRAEPGVSNVWLQADGGFICADARNAGTSAAVIVHPISMHRNISPKRVTRLSRASSPASTGFTTIVPNNPSPAPGFIRLTRILSISLCPDRPGRCRQTGKRKFANRRCLAFEVVNPRKNTRPILPRRLFRSRNSWWGCALFRSYFDDCSTGWPTRMRVNLGVNRGEPCGHILMMSSRL